MMRVRSFVDFMLDRLRKNPDLIRIRKPWSPRIGAGTRIGGRSGGSRPTPRA